MELVVVITHIRWEMMEHGKSNRFIVKEIQIIGPQNWFGANWRPRYRINAIKADFSPASLCFQIGCFHGQTRFHAALHCSDLTLDCWTGWSCEFLKASTDQVPEDWSLYHQIAQWGNKLFHSKRNCPWNTFPKKIMSKIKNVRSKIVREKIFKTRIDRRINVL